LRLDAAFHQTSSAAASVATQVAATMRARADLDAHHRAPMAASAIGAALHASRNASQA
jgi:hypothetical protein